MSDDVRDELAEALTGCRVQSDFAGLLTRNEGRRIAADILPVVRRYAARELRAAAAEMRRLVPELDWAERLDERADAVEAGE